MNAHVRRGAAMLAGLMIVVFAAGGPAAAQTTGNGGTTFVAVPPPYDMSYGQYIPKSATVAEGYLNGVSKVIRAEGDYNYYTALGAVSAAEALRQNIENRKALVEAYFELRKLNREYRAAERHPGRERGSQAVAAREDRPRLLTPHELDARTGKIRWPRPLAADTYAENREMLDEYFAERAARRGTTTQEMAELRAAILGMIDDLKEQRWALPPADYETANAFLRSLAYEGQRKWGEPPRIIAAR